MNIIRRKTIGCIKILLFSIFSMIPLNCEKNIAYNIYYVYLFGDNWMCFKERGCFKFNFTYSRWENLCIVLSLYKTTCIALIQRSKGRNKYTNQYVKITKHLWKLSEITKLIFKSFLLWLAFYLFNIVTNIYLYMVNV